MRHARLGSRTPWPEPFPPSSAGRDDPRRGASPPMPRPRTLGELKAAGYQSRSVREELRRNVIAKLECRETLFPGIVGYDQTVVPQIVNALLSKHDFILLGLRGQAKTRILRALVAFLDESIPAIEGCPLNSDPLLPLTHHAKGL